ncbi:hypothetical protein [Cytobacillus purgationiresistens]|uniref:Uncharacterized protein n=1 Tax=Cytobacillus purgationiresistens TaxID=863449 RepID=A0ABU0AIC1_9BACI|nr:hypothetical protein [Cytobacillus purgationiresistens]MDQ0270795.1 hypothetical protein [Cytobacillus purgationiresistens]
MSKVKSLKEIVEKLRSCGFECEAGPLENNVDFQLLECIAGVGTKSSLEIVARMRGNVAKARAKLTPITPQEYRDAIVEQAKKDVAELNGGKYAYRVCREEFVVNKEKRTVVALLRGAFTEKVQHRGIAKCAPSDCFNAHIGKAIALRRALGLEVPAEYLNAPHPTEVRVGDVVQWKGQGEYRYVINEKQQNNLYGFLDVGTGRDYGIIRYDNLTDITTVIDDTREGVDGE